MGIRTEKPFRHPLIFASLLLMLTALFTSRALLSAGIIFFIALACLHKNFPQQLKAFFSNPLLVGVSLLFFIPLVSGLWSDDKEVWLRFIRIKLPLLLLPLAFAGSWQLTGRQWKILAYCFIALLLLSCCWSLWQYLQHREETNLGYLKAKSIGTPLDNDHVRFSLLVCIGIVCTLMLWMQAKRGVRIALGLSVVFFIVYLHILSARTGLIGFYIFLLMAAGYLLFRSSHKLHAILILLALVVMPLLAWFCLPTFQNRIRYIVYDYSHLEKSRYLPGANDGNRYLSLKAGWQILKEHPFGVGAGDVVNETNKWYDAHVPDMLTTDRFFPSSEWLMYGGAAGWPAFFLFTVVMLLPFFQKKIRERFFWLSLNSIAAFSLVFDIGLEVQFGVFIYAFLVLWWWKWLQVPGNP